MSDKASDDKRLREPTEKGLLMYEANRDKLIEKFESSWKTLELGMVIDLDQIDQKNIATKKKQITELVNPFSEEFEQLKEFLIRTHSSQSQVEYEHYLKSYDEKMKLVKQTLVRLDKCSNDSSERRSTHSRKSKTKTSSKSSSLGSSSAATSMSTIITKMKAKAEAARVSMQFAEKEAELRKKNAILEEEQRLSIAKLERRKIEVEADVQLLSHQKAVAAAEAECRVFYESDLKQDNVETQDEIDSQKRTEQYVNEQTEFSNVNDRRGVTQRHLDEQLNSSENQRHVEPQSSYKILNPEAVTFKPNQTITSDQVYGFQPLDLTRFLLKKEILLSRLSSFNDKPESFWSWKSSFKNIMNELQCNSSEELDILVNYLGSESSSFAEDIKQAHANNPGKGLKTIWERLHDRYGRPEMIDAALRQKLERFPKITNRDNKKLYDLCDILTQIEAIKEDTQFKQLLAHYDSSTGILPIVQKLPHGIQEKWTSHAMKYKKQYQVAFPPFICFVDFIREMSRIKNDPSFLYETNTFSFTPKDKVQPKVTNGWNNKKTVFAKKTDLDLRKDSKESTETKCPLHKTNHTLNSCRAFRSKPLDERRKFLKDLGLCFRCCESANHKKQNCHVKIRCSDCASETHPSALHYDKASPPEPQGGEVSSTDQSTEVSNKCTQICGEFSGKSCSKTVLVNVYTNDNPQNVLKVYAILDEQSNRSLVSPDLFTLLNIQGSSSGYKLATCAGTMKSSGRRASCLTVESVDKCTRFQLPTVVECDIPNIREEIPSPEVTRYHKHLKEISEFIPEVDDSAQILLLIGRDLPEAHHILEQITGPIGSPFAQKLHLGWVIIGDVCLNEFHRPDTVTVNKTYLMRNGRMSICKPCPNKIEIKENFSANTDQFDFNSESGVFVKTKDDDKLGRSIEDNEFLEIMDSSVSKDSQGYWVAPLPFRSARPRLPNNKLQVLKRARSLDHSLRKDPVKRDHFFTFMQKVLDNRHAEVAPTLENDQECWYIPIFGVYHPKKPTQIRVVFDSSAKFDNVSLNDVLLSGPDLTNNLLGVLLRFRKDLIGVMADIQQMFYCFVVNEEHRDYLRFYWYRGNDPTQELIEYRMRVHVFGNSPSPAVATYCLRKTAEIGEATSGVAVSDFINRNFYVDDGLISLPTVSSAIDLMKATQTTLMVHGNLRLHKIASNNQEVMNAFPQDDVASHLKDIDIGSTEEAMQKSLGLYWNLQQDSFTYRVSLDEKPFTRRGILSVVNTLYDPLGFLAPIVIQGKLLLRELMSGTKDWDEPLSEHLHGKWDCWKNSLQSLDSINIHRPYANVSWNDIVKREVFVYSDASEKAIASVAFLKSTDSKGNIHVGFIMGKAKVAPSHGHSIPRLELCAAVLAVQISDIIESELDIDKDSFKFFTDSQIVLGYIHNASKRFYMYVANRVARIRKSSHPIQWSHIRTDLNPADVATRSIKSDKLQDSTWLHGSSHVYEPKLDNTEFPLMNPEHDKEIRPNVQVLKSNIHDSFALTHRCEKFSNWKAFVNAIRLLKQFVKIYKHRKQNKTTSSVTDYYEAEQFIVKTIQNEMFESEIKCIINNSSLPRNSRIRKLNPMLDDEGMLRIGGRITRSELDYREKHPLIIPGNHHLAVLLVRYFHQEVKHQGRHFTAGALRSAGYWIVGEKRLISSLLHKCVVCRKLRGKQEQQLMSDLPTDRLAPGPPFSSVGIDTFGPWSVLSRKTRGGQANSKRWALLFTCLTTRAIHIEVIEELSSSSFINALRRFIALRGSISEIRSDRGTNFVGSVDSLNINAINVEDGLVRQFLMDKRTVWKFNPPHASHMGGIWERMIGITRKILDSMMLEVQSKHLTHEVLTTFLAEVCAIVNGRPIVPVSSDPESPLVLSPGMLLTQKTGCKPAPVGTFDTKDLYKAQWRRVQYLADTFWSRWNKEYLQTLQSRRKWIDISPNLKQGDVVLIRDKNICRNEWPTGIIVKPLPGEDGRVRKAEVRVARDGWIRNYTRPISEMIVLIRD